MDLSSAGTIPQPVTDNQMETDQAGDGSGRRCNPKERMPE
jgi:hypothetical protein